MKLSGNLFFKMFLGFWLATVAIAASWMLTNEYFQELPDHEARRLDGKRGPPHRFMLRNIYALQNASDAEVRALLTRSDNPGEVRIYLLDTEGNDYLKRKVPDIVIAATRQLEHRRRGVRREGGTRYVAQKIYRSDQGKLRAVFVFPPPPSEFLRVLGSSPALRLLLAIGISGLVCFFLSRLLTRPVRTLSIASRELASGNLDTRAPARASGGDETDQLARDFNAMAEQLQERIVSQKRLLSDVSHELRSPLARLHVALALAQQRITENSATSENYLARIELEAQRLEQLIAQLLDSQVEPKNLDQHIDLVSLLNVVAQDAEFEGSSKRQQVTVTTDTNEALIQGNGELLRKCFDNILRNALTHSPPDTTVSVSLSQRSPGYQVTIEDEGPGVPEDALVELFTEFYRVDSARSRESGGYGLGLAIAKRAVALHRGSIHANNTHPGLRVTIQLPLPE